MNGIALLKGTVKHYDWGGTEFIPSLLNLANKEHAAFAEYWMGVHPQADCQIELPDGSLVSLRDYILNNAADAIGGRTQQQFGNMPYLFKALDVKNMLSIQVHPSKTAAEKDFEEENKKGIPIDSPQRNYKDANHKPELMVAMGEFWLLHGFKPEKEMKAILQAIPELSYLSPVFEEKGYKGLYQQVMETPQEEVNKRLQPLLDRIIPLYKEGKLDKLSEDYWAAKGFLTFSQPGKTDRGLFSVYLFNLVKVSKGDAVFQDAGVPHAYLEGQNIEIMASSDNVLRGGLTSKYVDVSELLKHVKTEATNPRILKGELIGLERVYKTPAPDFELSSFELKKGEFVSLQTDTADILLLVEGELQITQGAAEIALEKGNPSAVIFPGKDIKLLAVANSLVFRASVP